MEIIFLNGRKIESKDYEEKFIQRTFHELKNFTKFPQLVKIRNGKAIDISLNNEMFNSLNQGKDKSKIFEKVKVFFELE